MVMKDILIDIKSAQRDFISFGNAVRDDFASMGETLTAKVTSAAQSTMAQFTECITSLRTDTAAMDENKKVKKVSYWYVPSHEHIVIDARTTFPRVSYIPFRSRTLPPIVSEL